METITSRSAGGVIFDDIGRVALCSRRSFRGTLQWGLPKGLVERGESSEEAALREAREETGLEVEILMPLDTSDYWYVQPAGSGSPPIRVHKFVDWFAMRATVGNPADHDAESEEVALLEIDEAVRRASFKSERAVIELAVLRTAGVL